MGTSDAKGKVPQDVGKHTCTFMSNDINIFSFAVAIFHASFHPTKGNLIDWSLKASDGTKFAYFDTNNF